MSRISVVPEPFCRASTLPINDLHEPEKANHIMSEIKQNNTEEDKPGCFPVGLMLVLTFGGSTLGFAATVCLIGSQTSPDESIQIADVKGYLSLGAFIGALIGISVSFLILSFFSQD